jgi:hypothetical protein
MLLYCNGFIQRRPKLCAVGPHNSIHIYIGSIAPCGRSNTTELESEEAPPPRIGVLAPHNSRGEGLGKAKIKNKSVPIMQLDKVNGGAERKTTLTH